MLASLSPASRRLTLAQFCAGRISFGRAEQLRRQQRRYDSAGHNYHHAAMAALKQYVPDGMVPSFEGEYFRKMAADVSMEIGPTIIRPLPPNYPAATEKYPHQVRRLEIPGGGPNLTGYQGGSPFPSPQEPHKDRKMSLIYGFVISSISRSILTGWAAS